MKLGKTLLIIILFIATTPLKAKKNKKVALSNPTIEIVIGPLGAYSFAVPKDKYTTYKMVGDNSVQRIYNGSSNVVSSTMYQYELEELYDRENFILQDAKNIFPEANFTMIDLKKDKTYFYESYVHLFVPKSKKHAGKSVDIAYFIRGQNVVIINVLNQGAVAYRSEYIFKSFQWDLKKSSDEKTGLTIKAMPKRTAIRKQDAFTQRIDLQFAPKISDELSEMTVTRITEDYMKADILRFQKKHRKEIKPFLEDDAPLNDKTISFRYMVVKRINPDSYFGKYLLYQETFHYVIKDEMCFKFYLKQNLVEKENHKNIKKSPFTKEDLQNGYLGNFQLQLEEAWFNYWVDNLAWEKKS